MQSPESSARLSTDKNLVVVAGFSRPAPDAIKDIQHVRNFVGALTKRVQFASQRIVLGCPQEHAHEHPSGRIDFIRHAMGQAIRDRFVVGLSYGGLLSLGQACEDRSIPEMVLVDAPLNPHVEVAPPKDKRFDMFQYQYENRRNIALRCLAVLSDLSEQERGRILTMGTIEDEIVPPQAKYLPDIDHLELPPNIKGHGLTPAKIQEIVRIIVKRIAF